MCFRQALQTRFLLPSRPLAGRVERAAKLRVRGGGTTLAPSQRIGALIACSAQAAPPTPDPSPPLASLAGGGEQGGRSSEPPDPLIQGARNSPAPRFPNVQRR